MKHALFPFVLVLHLVGCGASSPVVTQSDALDTIPDSSRASLQMYIVLTQDASAMSGRKDVERMWMAVHGENPDYRSIHSLVKWVPRGYELDVELDFGRLPHPKLERSFIESLVTGLPDGEKRKALGATTAVFMRSRVSVLPRGNHIRLAGTAVLYAAEQFNGVILDLISRRAWTASQWREELEAPGLSARQIRIIRRNQKDGALSFQTMGMLRFGAPELILKDIDAGRQNRARRDFVSIIEVLKAQGGRAGQILPNGMGRLESCSSTDTACVSLSYSAEK